MGPRHLLALALLSAGCYHDSVAVQTLHPEGVGVLMPPPASGLSLLHDGRSLRLHCESCIVHNDFTLVGIDGALCVDTSRRHGEALNVALAGGDLHVTCRYDLSNFGGSVGPGTVVLTLPRGDLHEASRVRTPSTLLSSVFWGLAGLTFGATIGVVAEAASDHDATASGIVAIVGGVLTAVLAPFYVLAYQRSPLTF